jgi:hypothetical protein
MGIKLGKWSIGKSEKGNDSALDTARDKVVDRLRGEQRRLRGEAPDEEKKWAEIDADGIGQVKVYYRYFNLLGGDNCAIVGEVNGEADLADRIDEVIELVESRELDPTLEKAVKKEQVAERQERNRRNEK